MLYHKRYKFLRENDMRIVTLDEFLKLPPNTVFQKYEPCWFDELEIKMDSAPQTRDFYAQSVTGQIDCGSCADMFEQLDRAQASGESVDMHFHTECRDGLFNENQLFAVWERDDVEALIARLQETLSDNPEVANVPQT